MNAKTFPAACCGVSQVELGRRPASSASAELCKPRVLCCSAEPELAPGSSAGERTAFNCLPSALRRLLKLTVALALDYSRRARTEAPDHPGMTAGIDNSNNHRTVLFLKVMDGKVALGDQGPVIIIEFHCKTPRIKGDLICGPKVTFEEFVPTASETGGKIIVGELHILADRLQRYDRLADPLRRWIDFFSSSIVSVAT